jgi:GR25 family glycosyltransferase involved in LPS biosynthesis
MSHIGDFFEMFDNCICISLPDQIERRRHIEQHLKAFGVNNWEYIDGVRVDDPAVKSWYESGKVKPFPDCFRCGKFNCGSNTCNNVLLPQQVGAFLAHAAAWKRVVETRARNALIFEDDIFFTPYAPTVAGKLVQANAIEAVGLRSERATLLRLGWAKSSDHVFTGKIDIFANSVRMSNPMYALNLSLANELLEHMSQITTTADIYLHQQIAERCAGLSLIPPLAHDLSWSTGALDSNIHPKSLRVEYLKKYNASDFQEISATQKKIEQHVKHLEYYDVMAVTEKCVDLHRVRDALGRHNFDVGLGEYGKNGIVAWHLANKPSHVPGAVDRMRSCDKNKVFGRVLHVTQHPITSINVMVSVMNTHHDEYDIVCKTIEERWGEVFDPEESRPQRAAKIWLYWNMTIQERYDAEVVRVEQIDDDIRVYKNIGVLDELLSSKPLSPWSWKCSYLQGEENISEYLPKNLSFKIADISDRFGYIWRL